MKLTRCARCAALLCLLPVLALAGCTPKMTTVRPAEISEMVVTRLADGTAVTLPGAAHSADLKDVLIFQLEEPYEKAGACGGDDMHVYRVQLYIGDRLDTDVTLCADGAVCRGETRYIPANAADAPVAIADWDALFSDLSSGLSSPVAGEPSPDYGPVEFNAQGAPSSFAQAVDVTDCVPCADVAPWSYYISMTQDGGSCAVWRDDAKGDAELLLSVSQPAGSLKNTVEYAGGAEQSGGRYLYFTLCDAASFHNSLWVLDTQTLYFNRMYAAPCSNMVIPADPPADFAGLGWIVCGPYLVPVELEKAAEYTGGIIDLAARCGVPGEELFYGLGDFGTHKFVRLRVLDGTTLEIDSIVSQPETSAPERHATYAVDYAEMA